MAANSFLANYGGTPGNLTTLKGLGKGIGNNYGSIAGEENQVNQQRGSEYGTLSNQYQSMANGGIQNDSDIAKSILPELSSSYDTARQAGASNVAKTNNASGYSSFLDDLSRNQGATYADTFAKQKLQSKLAGLQGLQSLYGVDTSFLNELGNQQLGDLGLANSAESRRRGVLGTVGGVLGLAGQVGKGIAGGLSGGLSGGLKAFGS